MRRLLFVLVSRLLGWLGAPHAFVVPSAVPAYHYEGRARRQPRASVLELEARLP